MKEIARFALILLGAAAADFASTGTCNATIRSDWSVGSKILKNIVASSSDVCCAACTAEPACLAFVLHGTTCYLKGDAQGGHSKTGNTAGYVRAHAGE